MKPQDLPAAERAGVFRKRHLLDREIRWVYTQFAENSKSNTVLEVA